MDSKDAENYGELGLPSSKSQNDNIIEALRPFYSGVLVGNNEMTVGTAVPLIESGKIQMASFGRLYINSTQSIAIYFPFYLIRS